MRHQAFQLLNNLEIRDIQLFVVWVELSENLNSGFQKCWFASMNFMNVRAQECIKYVRRDKLNAILNHDQD